MTNESPELKAAAFQAAKDGSEIERLKREVERLRAALEGKP